MRSVMSIFTKFAAVSLIAASACVASAGTYTSSPSRYMSSPFPNPPSRYMSSPFPNPPASF